MEVHNLSRSSDNHLALLIAVLLPDLVFLFFNLLFPAHEYAAFIPVSGDPFEPAHSKFAPTIWPFSLHAGYSHSVLAFTCVAFYNLIMGLFASDISLTSIVVFPMLSLWHFLTHVVFQEPLSLWPLADLNTILPWKMIPKATAGSLLYYRPTELFSIEIVLFLVSVWASGWLSNPSPVRIGLIFALCGLDGLICFTNISQTLAQSVGVRWGFTGLIMVQLLFVLIFLKMDKYIPVIRPTKPRYQPPQPPHHFINLNKQEETSNNQPLGVDSIETKKLD